MQGWDSSTSAGFPAPQEGQQAARSRDELKFLLNKIEVFQALTLSTAVYYSDVGVKRVEENILGCLDSRTSLYLFT